MKYKTELHLHTKEVSDCGSVSAFDSAELYVAAGYHTVLVTDHMSRFTFSGKKYDRGESWTEKCDYYMRGYQTMLEAAAGRFNVLFGMELRSNTDDNDYLISTSCILEKVNMFSDNKQINCTAKFRYKQKDNDVEIEYLEDGNLLVKYPQGIKSVTPGQACVFYDGEECLGGGIIKEVRKNNKKLWYL